MWPDEGLTVIEELARADASVAWVAAVGSEGPSFYAYLPPDTYDKIFAGGPDVIHTGVINPTGKAVRDKGGYRFSGRWSFASGSNNADYICIHGVLDDGSGHPARRGPRQPGADRRRLARERAQGHRRATTSWSATCSSRTSGPGPSPSCRRSPGTRSTSGSCGARFGSEFAAVAIGIAQAALDDITDIARNKIPATSRSKLAQDPVAQYMTGQLATDLYMARTLLHQVARDDQASVAFGPPDDTATIIRRARLSRAASVAATVVEGAYSISGTTGLFESCPLQRRLRDVRAVTQHYMLSARSAYGPVGTAILSEDSAG